MRKLIGSTNLSQIRAIKSYLENYNIESSLTNEHQTSTPGAPSVWFKVEAELWILDDSKYEEASKLLQKWNEEIALREETVRKVWNCRKCREENPGTFDVCWNCGEGNPYSATNK